jgi:4,5:9,10-diseco-3-hydroxy-5,9,17-trioxoandrosta-1(10),2-diene-4-oate hydrolase
MADDPARLPVAPGDYGPSGRSPWLDVDWRTHQRWVTVGGRRANVIELGSGPPIVFIHGLSGSWQNWLEQLPVFAREHRVITFDLPGFGASELPSEQISISGYARWVDALLGQLGVESGAVVGNSMGGFIGAELAIQFPARVEQLVLVSAAGLTIENQVPAPVLTALRRFETRLGAYTGWLASRSEALTRRPRSRELIFGIVAHRAGKLPGPLVAEQVRGSGKPGFVPALDALTTYPIRDRLGEIACPTLIVWGTHDMLVPARDADEFERLIPNARKVVWPETGHVAMLERPEAFNRLLAAFLAEQPGERVGPEDAAGADDAPPARDAA